jgi:DNA replication protein DnaC
MKKPEACITIPETYEVQMNCTNHGNYNAIVVVTPEGREVHSECPECEHETLQRERHERFKEYEARKAKYEARQIFQESSVPKLFDDVSFESYKATCEGAVMVKDRLQNYAYKFDKILEAGACALLVGNTGTGKTMLATAVANHIMSNGHTAFYTKCPRALSRVKNTWSPHVQETQESEVNKYRKPDLLIIDEIPKGCTAAKDWEILHDILDRRTEDRRPVISISTMSVDQLRNKIGSEVFRRLHHKGAILEFTWETYKGDDHLF